MNHFIATKLAEFKKFAKSRAGGEREFRITDGRSAN